AITALVFPNKRASGFSITSSQRKRKGWEWVLELCVRSLNHTAALSPAKMLTVEVRASTLLFRQAPRLDDDSSKEFGFCDRRRCVGAKRFGAIASLCGI